METKRIAKKLRLPGLLFGCAFLLLNGCSSGTTDTSPGADAEARKAKIEAAKAAAEADVARKENSSGTGPVQKVELAGLDLQLAAEGKRIFQSKCSACHQLSEEKGIGPGLAGVTKRRKPEWVMNMMINPEEMTQKDPIAMDLLAEHGTQMMNQNVTEEDARKLLEYLRQNDAGK
jgi:mono/diheme cytochrome c family protein